MWALPRVAQVYYPEREKKKLPTIPNTEEVEVPKYSIFVGLGFLQHAGAGWKGYHALQYHTCKIPECATPKCAISFT